MAQVIYTNVYSINAQKNLSKNSLSLSSALERLSSGLRVNSARDDAAGLAVAQRMEADARGLTVAIRNASDGISFAQTADGALGTAASMMQRMRELAVQSLSGTIGDSERTYLGNEFNVLQQQITDMQTAAKLNGQSVFSTAGFSFQVGTTTNAEDQMTATFASVTTPAGTIDTAANASAAITAIDKAMDDVAASRANIGGVMGGLEFRIQQLETARENQYAARSRIMDADFAEETANMTRAQILQQAGTAMVAQANAIPQNVLTLLRG